MALWISPLNIFRNLPPGDRLNCRPYKKYIVFDMDGNLIIHACAQSAHVSRRSYLRKTNQFLYPKPIDIAFNI